MSELSTISADERTHAVVWDTLSPREQTYVESRIRGSLPVAAARVAGYANPDTKSKDLEAHPGVRVCIEAGTRAFYKRLQVTRDTVTEMLFEARDMAVSATEITGVARELGKLHGLYAPTQTEKKVDISVHKENISRASDQELLELVGQDIEVLDFEVVEEPAGSDEQTD